MAFRDDFDAPDLDSSVWLPHYLPAWSSREKTRASYRLEESCLVLDVPVDHPPWPLHEPSLRVSAVQSGNWSGPVGSTRGQQRFREGLRVREEQPRFEGWLPSSGHVEIRCRMTLSPRSMGAMWLAGFEDDAEQLRCGELCVVEIFGRSVRHSADGGSCEVGAGIKAFRDPGLTQDFDAPRLSIDATGFHTYAVDWDADMAVFSVDGREVRRCARPPTYPLQVMVAVYDFPEWSTGTDDDLVPELWVDHIAG
jgi:Glycosyl hydrolases family 16